MEKETREQYAARRAAINSERTRVKQIMQTLRVSGHLRITFSERALRSDLIALAGEGEYVHAALIREVLALRKIARREQRLRIKIEKALRGTSKTQYKRPPRIAVELERAARKQRRAKERAK